VPVFEPLPGSSFSFWAAAIAAIALAGFLVLALRAPRRSAALPG
jgi:hypothetical protein